MASSAQIEMCLCCSHQRQAQAQNCAREGGCTWSKAAVGKPRRARGGGAAAFPRAWAAWGHPDKQRLIGLLTIKPNTSWEEHWYFFIPVLIFLLLLNQ